MCLILIFCLSWVFWATAIPSTTNTVIDNNFRTHPSCFPALCPAARASRGSRATAASVSIATIRRPPPRATPPNCPDRRRPRIPALRPNDLPRAERCQREGWHPRGPSSSVAVEGSPGSFHPGAGAPERYAGRAACESMYQFYFIF